MRNPPKEIPLRFRIRAIRPRRPTTDHREFEDFCDDLNSVLLADDFDPFARDHRSASPDAPDSSDTPARTTFHPDPSLLKPYALPSFTYFSHSAPTPVQTPATP